MKYKKGTFVVVPNLDILENKPTELQTIFMWICSYADENGQCFPSRNKLSKVTGIKSVRTVDKYIDQLIELKLIEKTIRKKSGTKENYSNLYQICAIDALPQCNECSTPSATNDTVTISNINHTNITIKESKITLPIHRGNTPLKRVDSIYGTLFQSKYKFYPTVATLPSRLKVFKELLATYNELQIALLLIVFFNWRGMNDNNDKDQEFLISKSHALHLFKYNITQYETYVRNVTNLSKEFDDSDIELLKIIGENISTLDK